MSLSDFEEFEFGNHADQIEAFCDAFEKFAARVIVGQKFMCIATIEYSLPVGNETILDTINLWTSPMIITIPYQECFDEFVKPAVLNFLKRYENSDLLALTFRRCNTRAELWQSRANEKKRLLRKCTKSD